MSGLRGLAPWAVGGGAAIGGPALYNNWTEDEEERSVRKRKEWKDKYENPYFKKTRFPSFGDSVNEGMDSFYTSTPGTKESDPLYHVGKIFGKHGGPGYIGDTIRAAKDNPLTASLIGLILGALGGGGYGLFTGKGMLSTGLKGGLAGGLTGLLGHAAASYMNGTPNLGFGKFDKNTKKFEKGFKNPLDFYKRDPWSGSDHRPGPAYPGPQGLAPNILPGSSTYPYKSASFKKTFKKKAMWGSGQGDHGLQWSPSNMYKSGLTMTQQQALMSEVRRLNPQQMSTLQRLLAGASGAGAIYIIARYLLKLGSKATILSTILGGIMGSRSQTLGGMF